MKSKAIILFLLLFLVLYQDFPLVNYFGEIARSPIVFLSPFLLLYIFSQRRILITKEMRTFFYYIICLWVISIIYLFKVISLNGDAMVLGENIILKTIKMSIYPLIALIFYSFSYSFLRNQKNLEETLFIVFKYLQLFFACFLIVEIYYLQTEKSFLPFIHAVNEKYWRIRLLTLEESWTGTILILLIFFPIYLVNSLNKSIKEKRRIYFISCFIFISYAFVSESKGFLFLLLISVLPILLKSFFNNQKFKKLRGVLIPILIVGSLFIGVNFFDIVSDQLYSSGTFGTRFTSILASAKLFITNPFGVGWSGMVYYYPQEIQNVIDTGIVDRFILLEIKTYTNTTLALSTKTEFLDNLVQGGIFFLIFYYLFFVKKYIKLIKIKESIFLNIILLYMILAGVVYITYNIKYEVWFFMAYLDFFLNKKINEDSEERINCS